MTLVHSPAPQSRYCPPHHTPFLLMLLTFASPSTPVDRVALSRKLWLVGEQWKLTSDPTLPECSCIIARVQSMLPAARITCHVSLLEVQLPADDPSRQKAAA